MIIKKLWAVCIAVILAVQTAVSVTACAESARQTDAIFDYLTQIRGAESFYDGLRAGDADWYAFCRARLYGAQSDSEEFLASACDKAQQLLDSEGFIPPTDLQRTSLLLSAFGEENTQLLDKAVFFNDSLDRQGLNAYIWALIAAQGADIPENAINTPDSLIDRLLAAQLSDGGFNLIGEGADTDITAAVIYALAPYSDRAEVKSALTAAEAALTAMQCESGGFMSMGVENCESAAQAVIAFTAIGCGENDERVSRAISALTAYRQTDGGFSHLIGGSSNAISTAQALEAFAAIELLRRGEALFEVRHERQIAAESAESALPEQTESAEVYSGGIGGQTPAPLSGAQIKLIICGGLAVAGVVVLIVFFARGKRNKALLAACAALFLAGIAAAFLDIKNPEEYYNQQFLGSGITVEISADCGNALARMDDICPEINPPEIIPPDGVVIAATEITLQEGATAFDALVAAAGQGRIRVDYTGSVYGVYVTGIGYIYEFGFGSQSGWMYRVNGEIPQVSAGEYTLSQGDFVEYIYTCNAGGDIR
ncbi:MAG: DUF4430 domain-containing protein [Oscillospiraceae bacterium]